MQGSLLQHLKDYPLINYKGQTIYVHQPEHFISEPSGDLALRCVMGKLFLALITKEYMTLSELRYTRKQMAETYFNAEDMEMYNKVDKDDQGN